MTQWTIDGAHFKSNVRSIDNGVFVGKPPKTKSID